MIRNLTLEKLESSEEPAAVLWRLLRTQKLSTNEIAEALGWTFNQVANRTKPLRQQGWIRCASGRGTRSRPFRWSAFVVKQSPASETPGAIMRRARRRLSGIQKQAHEARFSGLASTMARALQSIEKEAVEIRDELRCP